VNKNYRTEVELGMKTRVHQGISSTYPKAVVTIETDDEEFHLLILTSLALVENLDLSEVEND
jgi:hypothetical protein